MSYFIIGRFAKSLLIMENSQLCARIYILLLFLPALFCVNDPMRRREGSCYFKVLFLETNIASRVTTNSTLGDPYNCIYRNWSQTVWRDWKTVSTHRGVDHYISHNYFTKKMKSLLISNKSCTGYTNFFYFKYI